MKSICAWCGKHLRGNPSDGETSHGICPLCAEKVLNKVRSQRSMVKGLRDNRILTGPLLDDDAWQDTEGGEG